MEDVVIVLILLAIVTGILWYFIREKKRSETSCIGCPYANQCGSRCNGKQRSNRSAADNKKAQN